MPDRGARGADQGVRGLPGLAATLRFDDGALEFEVGRRPPATRAVRARRPTAATTWSRTPAGRHRGRARHRLRRRLVSDARSTGSPPSGGEMTAEDLGRGRGRRPGSTCPRTSRPCSATRRRSRLGSDFDPEVLVQLRRRQRRPGRRQDQGRPRRDRGGARQARGPARARRAVLRAPTPTATRSRSAPTPTTGQLLEDGGLGDTDVFQDVVPRGRRGQRDPLRQLRRRRLADQPGRRRPGGRRTTSSRSPALGVSSWIEDDTAHAVCCGSRPTDDAQPADPVDDRPGHRDQVGRGELDVEAAAAAGDVDRRVVEGGRRRRRSGAGASGRTARSRPRRTRWRARRAATSAIAAFCRRARGPAP